MKQALIVLTLLSASVQLTYAQAKDTIWRRDNKMISGEISKVSPDYISIKSGGQTQDVLVGEIDLDRLRFRDDPSGLKSVRSSVGSGQLEDALKELASLKPSGRPFVKEEIEYFNAVIQAKLALKGKSDVKAAAREVGTFLKNHPNSFRYYEASRIMGDLAVSLGRFDSAAKYYERLTRSKSDSLSAQGALLLGDALLLQGDVQGAAAMFSRCEKSADLRMQSMGQLGTAVCQLSTPSGAEQAITKIEKVIAENDSSDVSLFARAYNSLGQAYLAAGKTEAALDAYLHTDLLFYRDVEKHAEALFHLSNLWAEVNKPTEANKARQTLKKRYASSVWAKR